MSASARNWDRPLTDWIGAAAQADAAPLIAELAPLLDPAAIPPRQWLYGTSLIRRYMSLIIAPGGVGKTAMMLAIALCLATGRNLLGEHVHKRVKVWMLHGDDPAIELDRRIAALMIYYGITRAELDGWFYRNSARDRRLTVVATQEDGSTIVFPDKTAVIAEALRIDCGCIMVDPWVKAHQIEENSNAQMDAAATAWAEVADATDCAISCSHHARKGLATDVDAARGAKSLSDAARVAQIVRPMTIEECQMLGLPEADRLRHIRVDDVKVNLAPRADLAHWYRLESVPLGNATAEYPSGDHVAAMVAWTPPSPWGDLPGDQVIQILDTIEIGPAPAMRYHENKRGSGDLWAGSVIMKVTGKDEATAARIIRSWVSSTLLIPSDYIDPEVRKTRHGVSVNQDTLAQLRAQFAVQRSDVPF